MIRKLTVETSADSAQNAGQAAYFAKNWATERIPGSRRKAYYLMSIHEHLPPQGKRTTKTAPLARCPRGDCERCGDNRTEMG